MVHVADMVDSPASNPLPGLLFLTGPTASGKSGLAATLAERLHADIVNADAMQVYADLRVLSARPDDAALARAPHHLYGHVDAAERYSAGRWAREAGEVIRAILARGRRALVTGGTGLYIRALTHGLSDVPTPPDDVRARTAALLAEEGVDGLAREAARLDPELATTLAPTDRQRLTRIVEVGWATGRALSSFQGQGAAVFGRSDYARLALNPPREALRARIAKRAGAMLEDGAAHEAAALAARGLDPDLPAMKALGVADLAAVAAGDLDRATALERLIVATRRYAKRQRTWLRGQASDWPVIETQDVDAALGAFAADAAPQTPESSDG